MNPIELYYRSFENIKKYFDSVKDNNKLLIFSRVPVLNRIQTKLAQDIIYKICIIIEPLASLLIITVKLLPWCMKAAIIKRQPLSDTLYIDNCPLMRGRTVSAGKYEDSIDWIYSFDVDKKEWDQKKRCHCLFEYVNVWNVIQAYGLSFMAILGAQKKLKFKYVFRTFNSFEFFLMYYVLKNIPKDITLCFCNQMDRWAVLFDNAPQTNRVLFQHGIEMPYADWPVKFEHTNTAYVLSMEESELLIKASFKNRPHHVYLMNPTMELTDINEDLFTVLIVGFPSYGLFENELSLVKALTAEGIKVYLKPHPGKEDMTKYLNLEKEYPNCRIILEKMFPDVDVVCSYRSTLAVEYQAHNKFVMMYDDYPVEEMIEKIKELQKGT